MLHKHFLHILALLSVLCWITGRANAQNEPPVISAVHIEQTGDKEIKVNYQLGDKEDKNISVSLLVSADNRQHFQKQETGFTGDIGTNITPGAKSFTWRYNGAAALKDLAIRLVADDGYRVNIPGLLAQVDTNRLRNRLNSVAVVRDAASPEGKNNLAGVKKMMENNFTTNRFDLRKQPFVFGGFSGENFIAKKKGTQNPDSIFVIVAAFDGGENSRSANNNGSGLAGLLEISDIVSRYNFRNTIVVLSTDYAGEEFIGSDNYVFRGGIEKYEKVGAALDMDRIGTFSEQPNTHPAEVSLMELFPDNYKQILADSSRANFLRIISNPVSKPLADFYKQTAAEYVPDLKIHTEEFPGYGEFVRGNNSYVQFSDHICFWYRKYKAIWITDAREGGRRDNTMEDIPEKLNLPFMSKVVKITLASLVKMAGIENSAVYETSLSGNNPARDSK